MVLSASVPTAAPALPPPTGAVNAGSSAAACSKSSRISARIKIIRIVSEKKQSLNSQQSVVAVQAQLSTRSREEEWYKE